MFCLFIGGLAALLLTGPDKAYSENEKRYLSERPEFSWQSAVDSSFQEKLESWVADQFPGRNLWVGLHSYANYFMGRNAQQDIYLAKDGYLINAPSTDDLTMFETTLTRFEAFAEKAGLPATMLMVPSTGWLKEELLPLGHGEYADDRMFDRAEELTDRISCIDLREELRAADRTAPVAYRTDHHLTSFGNYTLYMHWRIAAGKEYLSEESYQVETVRNFYGTTWSGSGYWLTEPDEVQLWDSGVNVTVTISDGGEEDVVSDSLFFRAHLDEADKYPVFLDGNHSLTKICDPEGTEGTLLIIKDSYAHGFVPFLAEHYGTIYMIDLRYYRGRISDFVLENGVDELLFLYGTSTLLTDSNSAWLF